MISFLFLRGTTVVLLDQESRYSVQLEAAWGRRLINGLAWIHHQELGDGQYVEGTPQAGAGAVVGNCLCDRSARCTGRCPTETVSETPTLILERRKGSRNSEAKPQFGHRDGVIPGDRRCNPWASCLLLPPGPRAGCQCHWHSHGGCVGMQVKILTRTMKVKSEHHKASGSSSAKAHRVRAADLPSHWPSEIQRSSGIRRGKLSPKRCPNEYLGS
jgi:hypothetical protein